MKNLLYKEWKLATHPTTFIFLSFGLMLLIPNYPGYVALIYMCLSIFFLFLTGRENKDIFFTVSLPIRKQDVVKARCMMIALIELTQILLMVPFAILRTLIFPENVNMAGIEANVAFFGLAFGLFGVFNFVFIPLFYRTAYKIGVPFLWAGLAVTFYFVVVESLVWIPSPIQRFLDSTEPAVMVRQLPILLVGILLWAFVTGLAYRRAKVKFNKVDL